MHPHIQYELMKARTGDVNRRAELDYLALAARRARQAQHEHGTPRRSELAERLFRVLRGWQPSRRSAS